MGLNVELTLADADGVGDILREDGEAAGNGWRITDGSEQKGVDSSCARLLSQLKGTPRPVIDEIKGRSTRGSRFSWTRSYTGVSNGAFSGRPCLLA